MTDPVLAIFNIKDLVVNSIRDLPMHDVNQENNNTRILKCRSFLCHVRTKMEILQSNFFRVQNISCPQTELGKFQIEQCLERMNGLAAILRDIEKRKKFLTSRVYPTVLSERIAMFENQQCDIEKELERLQSVVVSLDQVAKDNVDPSADHEDSFKFVNMVPANPTHIALDFREGSKTPESELKSAIFNENSCGTVTAVAGGMGGVGKTCALRGVGLHPEAPARFPGGILYLSVGEESGKGELIRKIASMVRRSGGKRKSLEVQLAESLPVCVNLTREWFGGHICLFLIDDVCCNKGIDASITEVLAGLSTESRSRIAFTTRDASLRSTVKIRFDKRDQSSSVRMLLHSAGLSNGPEEPKEISAMKAVVNRADGLPMALNVIGSRARYLVDQCRVDQMHVWSNVSDLYEKSSRLLSGKTFHNDQNKTIKEVLFSTLNMINGETNDGILIHLFQKLGILLKRQQVTFDDVKRIWNLSTEETNRHLEVFVRFNIIELQYVHCDDQNEHCIVLHDLFIDMARQLSEHDPTFLEKTARNLLFSYVDGNTESNNEDRYTFGIGKGRSSVMKININNKNNVISKIKAFLKRERQTSERVGEVIRSNTFGKTLDEKQFHDSWIAMDDDGFARHNLIRLMHTAKMMKQCIALLSDPRWIARQMDAFCWKKVDTDFAEALSYLEKDRAQVQQMSENDNTEVQTFLCMVRGALVESERHVKNTEEPGMLTTQIYGRLFNYRGYPLVKQFLERLEQSESASWMKSSGAFPAPVPSYTKHLDIGDVYFVRYGDENCVEIMDYDSCNCLFRLHQYCCDDDKIISLKEWVVPSSVTFRCAVLSKDRNTFAVATGAQLQVFQEKTNDDFVQCINSTQLSMDNENISALSMSKDGCNIITGNCGGKLVLWRKTIDKWKEGLIGTHKEEVNNVAISECGRCVISSSLDRTAVISEFDGDTWRSTVLRHRDVVCSVMSSCGTFVVTGSRDGKAYLSRAHRNGWKEEQLQVELARVDAVELSADKRLILCGNKETIVLLMWERTGWAKHVLNRHGGDLTNLAFREGSTEAASSSNMDGTVRIRDFQAADWKPSEIQGHTTSTIRVSVSPNRVESTDRDGNTIVWSILRNTKVGHGKWKPNVLLDCGRDLVADSDRCADGLYLQTDGNGSVPSPEYCIKREGNRKVDTTTNQSIVLQCGSTPLPKHKWPAGLSSMEAHWENLYRIPVAGSDWFAVQMRHKPWLDIMRLVQTK